MTLAKHCNSFVTNGISLNDLPAVRDKVAEAVKLHAQEPGSATYPDRFSCSHCGSEHRLTPEKIKDMLFRGPGAYDFPATFNEFAAMVERVPAASVGFGVTDSTEKDFFDPPFVADEEVKEGEGTSEKNSEEVTEEVTEDNPEEETK